MTFASYESEDCLYNTRVFYCTDCNDCALCYKCELCYECVDCINSYGSDYCTYCENVTSCENCHHCIGTQNCYGCVGLNHAQFKIFNEQYEEAEYHKKIAELTAQMKKEGSFGQWFPSTYPEVSTYGL